MNDVKEIIRKTMFADRWRSWVGVVFFLGFGVLCVGLAATSSPWNGDIWAAFLVGLLSAVLGVFFVVRQRRLPAMSARLGELFTTRLAEIAWIYEQVVVTGQYGRKVWNVFVWTTAGEKMRIAVYREDTRNALWNAITAAAPHAVAPYSKERERELKSVRTNPAPAALGRAA